MQQRPVALVTGAGSGIGAATASRLVAAGYDVVAIGRRRAPLEALRAEVGGAVEVCPADLADADRVVEVVRDVVARRGRLDVVVNNAGDAWQADIADTDPARFRSLLEVNLVGPAAVVHAAWPAFLAQRRGCIVNVSSLAQFDPFPGFFAYAPSKAGLHLLTVVAASEGGPHGVRAFTVAPGVVDTPLHQRLVPDGVDDAYRLDADTVAGLVVACVEGVHDDAVGATLAAVTPAVAPFVRDWMDRHPNGGVRIMELHR